MAPGRLRSIALFYTLQSKEQKRLLFFLKCYRSSIENIVRIGPNALSMKSATAFEEIHEHASPLVKSHDFYSAFSAIPGLYNNHNAVDQKMHLRKGQVMAHA
jgi:hypothetical protein